MLSHTFRFHGHGSLRYLHRNGRSARNRVLLIKYTNNPHRSHSRVAVIVGKKVAKSAVKRNRIRRRIFEVIRKHWSHMKPHTDMAVTVFSPELLTMSATEVEKNVLSLLLQAGIYSKTPVDSAILDHNL